MQINGRCVAPDDAPRTDQHSDATLDVPNVKRASASVCSARLVRLGRLATETEKRIRAKIMGNVMHLLCDFLLLQVLCANNTGGKNYCHACGRDVCAVREKTIIIDPKYFCDLFHFMYQTNERSFETLCSARYNERA